jgi:hypothetical protein
MTCYEAVTRARAPAGTSRNPSPSPTPKPLQAVRIVKEGAFVAARPRISQEENP